MFKNLEDFGAVRSTLQAFGFYIAYLGLYLIVGALSGVLVSVVSGSPDTAIISRIAGPLVVIMTGLICYLIISKKKLGFMYWILALLACGLSIIGGGILGLLIPAFMTNVTHQDTPKADSGATS